MLTYADRCRRRGTRSTHSSTYWRCRSASCSRKSLTPLPPLSGPGFQFTCVTNIKVEIVSCQYPTPTPAATPSLPRAASAFAHYHAYAHVCSRMLTYAHVCSRMLSYALVCSRMLTYAHVCSHMLTYAHVCSRMCLWCSFGVLTAVHVWGCCTMMRTLVFTSLTLPHLGITRMLTYAHVC
jgi:hypothetical protein